MSPHRSEQHRRIGPLAVLCAVAIASCSSSEPTVTLADAAPSRASASVSREPPLAEVRVAELRQRLVLESVAGRRSRVRVAGPSRSSRPAIAEGVVERFEPVGLGTLRPIVAAPASHGVMRPASVLLPARADQQVEVADGPSRVAVRFVLEGAVDAPIEIAGGFALYRAVLGGADVVHRPYAEGAEDFAYFATQPAHEALVYRLDVSRVAGLRLFGNVLEFLDAGGAPRLRAAAPYAVDARGQRVPAIWSIEGCAVDRDPRPAFARRVTAPGTTTCLATVTWQSSPTACYPMLVDPGWSTTGSMSTPRSGHVAAPLPGGKVLVTGGAIDAGAEVFDSASGAWSVTGSMSVRRVDATASVLASSKVLVVGGFDDDTGAFVTTAELYDPTSGRVGITA